MKFLIPYIIIFLLSGCSGAKIAENITSTQIAMSGNKPPAFFSVANVETMRDYVFEAKGFSFKFPTAKESDFSNMGGWSGMSIRDGRTIAFGFKNSIVYHIAISTPLKHYKYTERERAIESKDISYIRKRKKWLKENDKLNIQNFGRENYLCEVTEFTKYNGKKQIAVYTCYKFNPTKTKSKDVSISITYNKPKDPILAKEYTYQDLKKRAKWMLDSLYIQDGW